MRWFRRLRKLRGLSSEIDEELRFHIEEKERRLIADGLTPAQARREAPLAHLGAAQGGRRTRSGADRIGCSHR